MERDSIASKTYGLGRFEVIGVLGRGHFSTVYKAFDNELGRQVALKVLGVGDVHRDIAKAMFDKEVGALSGFKHNHVVRLVHHFIDRATGDFCIVLELVPNAVSLDIVIADAEAGRREPLRLDWLLGQLKQIALVLDYAHTKRIIHRDVKPANLLLGGHSGAEVVRLADFGVARLLEHYGRSTSLTLPQFASVPFAPPEQLRQGVAIPASDYYSFGVTCVALLTHKMPHEALVGPYLETLLDEVAQVFESVGAASIARSLFRDLLKEDPNDRPLGHVVVDVLDSLAHRVRERPQVGIYVPYSVRTRIEELGYSVGEFIRDLSTHTVGEYQENLVNGEKRVNIMLYGLNVRAVTTADRENPEQLVLVDVRRDQPDMHKRRRENRDLRGCSYEIVEGTQSAYDLLNEFYDYHVANRDSRRRFETKEDLLSTGMYILDRLEEDATELVIGFRKNEIQDFEDLLVLSVIYVRASGRNGLASEQSFDSEVIEGWIESLDKETLVGLGLQGKKGMKVLGRIRDYNPYTHELTLHLSSNREVPVEGELECQNVAQLASNRRQRNAVERLLADSTVNLRLGELLVDPSANSVGPLRPIELIQDLEPRSEVQRIIEHAMAAEDMFLIQGPPGTGKTAMITELVLQLLQQEPNSRILITAQANPAVDNAMERIRSVAAGKQMDIRTLRLTRGQGQGAPTMAEFEDSFAIWAKETSNRSLVGMGNIGQRLTDEEFARVEDAVANWRERIQWAADVRRDYAHSVSVYGVTCLMTPTLWELLDQVEFDWVIVDEAAKATDTEVLVPLIHGRRIVLVGDQRQLPPYIHTEIERQMVADGLDRDLIRTSLFEKIFDATPQTNRVTLKRQYRMHRTLGEFVGRLFYSDIGGLETGVTDEDRDIQLDWASKFDHRAFWVHLPNGREEQVAGGTSYYNESEAIRIRAVLEQFNRELTQKGVRYSVGVITPYSAQVNVLHGQIVPKSSTWSHLDIEVSTVDSFQGKENDITMYSMVRTSPGSLRFVEDEKRLNVSLSRAKRLLMLFGNKDIALSSTTFRRALELLPKQNILTGGANGSN